MQLTDSCDLRELQLILLDCLKYFDQYCRIHSLTYYLAYGTLLGAVRHEGFIPWDDDVDVWMPREDFMRLYELLCSNREKERYQITESEWKLKGSVPAKLQMKIIDTHIKCKRRYLNESVSTYPWIDIFCLDQFPDENKGSFIRNFRKQLAYWSIVRMKDMNVISDNEGTIKRIIFYLNNKIHFLNLINQSKCDERLYKSVSKYQNVSDEVICNEYFSYASCYMNDISKCIFDKQWFGKPKELLFENTPFYVPSNWDMVLHKIYGDYMKLPPESDRIYKHECTIERNESNKNEWKQNRDTNFSFYR